MFLYHLDYCRSYISMFKSSLSGALRFAGRVGEGENNGPLCILSHLFQHGGRERTAHRWRTCNNIIHMLICWRNNFMEPVKLKLWCNDVSDVRM